MSDHDVGHGEVRRNEVQRGEPTERMSRAKFELVVGAVDDPAEAEADLAADAALDRIRRSEPRVAAGSTARTTRVRRSSRVGDDEGGVDTATAQRVRRSTGKPIPPDMRRTMEGGFGADFGRVRFHTGTHVDELNDRFAARAFTVGSDIYFRGGQPNPATTEGQRLVAHELAHTLQQDTSIRRFGGKKKTAGQPTVTKVSREGYHDRLVALVPADIMEERFDSYTTKMKKALIADFGVEGMSWRRSEEARTWRQGLKDVAREQGRLDVAEAMVHEKINLETERAFYKLQAEQKVYDSAKGSLEKVLKAGVNTILETSWTGNQEATLRIASTKAVHAGWGVYQEALWQGKSVDTVQKKAQSAAKKAALDHIEQNYAAARAETIRLKRTVMDKPNKDAATAMPGAMTGLDQEIRDQVKEDELGRKALETVVEADSVTSGLGIVGKLLDQAVGSSGDQISLSVEVRVPIPDTPAYVSFGLTGKAARGIDGAMTAGVPVFGDPRRLELMVELAFKAGVDLIGFDLNAALKFFVRGGGNDTELCMKAFSYGAYRTIAAVSDDAANWWAGADKRVTGSKTAFAESWAAMLEQQAFKEGGGYVDIGAGIAGSAAAKFQAGGSGFEAGLEGGGSAFWRYDDKALQDSLGNRYGRALAVTDPRSGRPIDPVTQRPITDAEIKQLAKERRENVSGRGGGSWGVSASVKAEILGQGVTFAGSISGPAGPGALGQFGIEVSGTISYASTPADSAITMIERWGAGCATAIADLVKNLIGLRKAKTGGVLHGAANVTQIVNSGLDNAITDGLGSLWEVEGTRASMDMFSSGTPDAVSGLGTSSTLQVALIIGYDGDAPIVRLEIRSGRKLEINATMGTVGIKVSAEKTSRLLAAGYDKGGWDFEAFGVRARKREGQRETTGHHT